MNKLFLILAITALPFLFQIEASIAVCSGGPTVFTCNTAPPNPDLNGIQEGDNDSNLDITLLPGSAIQTAGQPGDLDCIDVGDGNNTIKMTRASCLAQDDGIVTDDGNNTITVEESHIETTDTGDPDAIDTGDGNDIINVIKSTLISFDDDGITSGLGDDTIFVSHSEIEAGQTSGANFAVASNQGNDTITVKDSVLIGGGTPGIFFSINAADGNDDIIFQGSGSELVGPINCGDGFDTITFALTVPEEFIAEVNQKIADAPVPDGLIQINGLIYEWQECELITGDLTPGNPGKVRPIPTLSEWGLIAMAGILGITGLFVVRRRVVAA